MSLPRELEVELTNVWSLLHATASGCISIAVWEGLRMAPVSDVGHWAIYLVASVALVHSVRLHRNAVAKKLEQARLRHAVQHTIDVLDESVPVQEPALTAEPDSVQ